MPCRNAVPIYRRWLQLHYRSSSREVRRLEALALSPVYGAFGAVAGAAPAIRAFAAQEHFAARAAAAITAHQRAAITGGVALRAPTYTTPDGLCTARLCLLPISSEKVVTVRGPRLPRVPTGGATSAWLSLRLQLLATHLGSPVPEASETRP